MRAAARAEVLLAHFGECCDVRQVTPADLAAYATRWKAGGIKVDAERTTKPVRTRAVEADLALLKAMVSWAATVRTNGGAGRWLERNPLDGLRVEREADLRRPVTTWERFEKTRAAIATLRAAAEEDRERLRWTKLEL